MDYSPRHLHAIDSPFALREDDEFAPSLAGDDFTRSQVDLFGHLIEAVGGVDALWRLDARPLPDEPFDCSVVDSADVPFAHEVVALSDRCCDEILDIEFRTITRRILARVAARDPGPLRRSRHAARCAAALVWLAGQANGEFGRRGRRTASWLWAWFGVANSSDRGRSLRSAAGLEPERPDYSRWGEPLTLGDASLLHSAYRGRLAAERDLMLDLAGRRRTLRVEEIDGTTARIEVRAETTKVVSAVKGIITASGRGTAIVGFGDRVDDAHYVSLSIPDAQDLVRRLHCALETPLPKI